MLRFEKSSVCPSYQFALKDSCPHSCLLRMRDVMPIKKEKTQASAVDSEDQYSLVKSRLIYWMHSERFEDSPYMSVL